MTKKEYDKLKNELREECYNYYVLCKPKLTDYQYDEKFLLLKKAEESHPEWVDEKSPTQFVGAGDMTFT